MPWGAASMHSRQSTHSSRFSSTIRSSPPSPTAKMSTTYSSESGLIYVDDEPDEIRRKVKRAQTDSGSEVRRGEGKEGIANLLEIYADI